MRKAGRIILRLLLWALFFGWTYMAFYLSAQTGSESAQMSIRVTRWIRRVIFDNKYSVSTLHYYIRKLAHFAVFAVEGGLLTFAMQVTLRRMKGFYISAVGLVLLLASLNEYMQRFIKGRGPSIKDVGIDFAGALAGILVAGLIGTLIKRRIKKKYCKKCSSHAHNA